MWFKKLKKKNKVEEYPEKFIVVFAWRINNEVFFSL